ncbi:hypothetical protein [Streptomyces althioticus]|uniref:hypothetical protein n=1 Tax=Streptomyces althioticus TaxID=83380 RepID=UPI0038058826
MIEIENEPEYFSPEKVDVQKFKNGLVKVRFTLEGKRYKMLMDEDTFNSLETPPGQLIKELTAKESSLTQEEWEKQNDAIMIGILRKATGK